MTEQELVREGIDLMLIGMGTVFVFLTVLVIATRLMSRVVALFPEDAALAGPTAESAAESAGVAPATSGVHPDVVAAIAAAIRRHRQRGGRD